MRAITEGPVLGLAAAAQGDDRLVGGDGELVTLGVDDRDRTLHHDGAVVAQANSDF